MLLDDEYTPGCQCFFGLSDIVGAVSGTLGSVFGAGEDVSTGQESQARQAQINERQYRNRYQWQMEDMRKAGLNPILSYKQGAPGLPGVGGYSSDYAGAIQKGVQNTVAMRMLRENVANVKADTALKNSQAEAAEASALLSNSAKTLNDITAILRAPELHGTRELMDLIKEGGRGADVASAINRLRTMLGIGGSR